MFGRDITGFQTMMMLVIFENCWEKDVGKWWIVPQAFIGEKECHL